MISGIDEMEERLSLLRRLGRGSEGAIWWSRGRGRSGKMGLSEHTYILTY